MTGLIPVAVTPYLQGKELDTVYFKMPQVPCVGDSLHIEELDRIWRVGHVRWVEIEGPVKIRIWTAEIEVSA